MNPFQDYFIDILKNKYATFEGRARRSEYWYFILFKWVSIIGISMVSGLLSFISDALPRLSSILIVIFYFGLIIPTLAVTVRRLHDSGNSGWLLLLQIIPLIGPIIILIFTVTDSDAGINQWGPNPKTLIPENNPADLLLDDDIV